jgi:NAD(P)-dependent dehydrogenase (short-subunit alcohol dehydrogenase family)
MTAHRSAPLMKGRICLITGGTGWIGRQTAEGLAHLGASLIIVGRDQERGERAVSEIQPVNRTNERPTSPILALRTYAKNHQSERLYGKFFGTSSMLTWKQEN